MSIDEIIFVNQPFEYVINLYDESVRIRMISLVDFHQWKAVYIKSDNEVTPEILFSMFDDYRNNQLDDKTKFIFPTSDYFFNHLSVKIIYTISWFKNTTAKEIIITFSPKQIMGDMMNRKFEYHHKMTNRKIRTLQNNYNAALDQIELLKAKLSMTNETSVKKFLFVHTRGSGTWDNATCIIHINFPNGELADIHRSYSYQWPEQRSELYAILSAIRYINKNLCIRGYHIVIGTSSLHSVNCVTSWTNDQIKNGRKSDVPVLNRDLIEAIHTYWERDDIVIKYIETNKNTCYGQIKS